MTDITQDTGTILQKKPKGLLMIKDDPLKKLESSPVESNNQQDTSKKLEDFFSLDNRLQKKPKGLLMIKDDPLKKKLESSPVESNNQQDTFKKVKKKDTSGFDSNDTDEF